MVLAPLLTAAIVKPIEQVTHRLYPGIEVVPVLQAAGTDAVHLSESGIPSYGISGMFVDPDLGNVHGLNECIRVQSLYDGRDFLFALSSSTRSRCPEIRSRRFIKRVSRRLRRAT